jgi:MFS family permease
MDDAASAEAPVFASRKQPIRMIFGALMLVMLLASLDQTIVSTALPTIVGEFGGLAHLSWIVTAYLLATTIVTPLYGKLGDLFGRKIVLQTAILLFLAGSALCGLSQSMGQLIGFRALQGLGGGGLIVVTMAAIGDIFSPRERGRYQGVFGGIFGLSTVLGPLIGGFFVEHLSWRWIFYVNLPLGPVAVTIIGLAFTAQSPRRRPSIDIAGAALLAVTLTALILLTSLGGHVFAWGSPQALGLAAGTVAGLAAFIAVERRSAEPILPLHLFGNRVFVIACAVGFIVGLATLGVGTSTWTAGGYMLVLGLGLGLVMQVLVLAVQNAVDYRDLGVATSGTTLFRSIGGSIGVSLFGAIFTATLTANLAGRLPAGAALPAATAPDAIQALPAAVRTIYLEVFTAALHPVYLYAAAVGAVGFALTWFLKELPLRTAARAETLGERFAMPRDATSLEELERIIAQLLRREHRWEAYRRIAESSGVELAPDAIWLLVQLCLAAGPVELAGLSGRFKIPPARLDEIAERLTAAGMVEPLQNGTMTPTGPGRENFRRMVAARRASLTQMLERWSPESHAEVKAMLDRLARSLIAELPSSRYIKIT